MAELTPIPAAQRPAEPGYQPLSGYAVAAAIVAGLFAVILVVLVGIGLYYRRTPLSVELLIVPLAGMVLAAVGRAHIRNSEGTRTGTSLANAALWICALGGAGFAAFLGANYLALEMESRRKADAFLESLKAGNAQEAFAEHVLPPELRGRADPGAPNFEEVYTPAGYPVFAGHRLVRAVRQNRESVEFEHVGARDVGQEGEGFKATHTYRVTVPEGVFVVQLKMVAAESKGGKPQWHIQGGAGLGITEPDWEYYSEYGRLVMEAEEEAGEFARRWMADLSNARPGIARLYLLPLAERESAMAARHGASFLGGAVAAAVPPPGGTDQEFDRLLRAGFFRRDAAGNPLSDSKVTDLRQSWKAPSLMPASPMRRGPAAGPAETGLIELTPERVTVGVPADLVVGRMGESAPALIGVVCSDPALISLLSTAREKGAAAKYDGSVSLRSLPPRDWRIAWVETTMELPAKPPLPGAGPGGPRMGPPES